MSMFKHWCETTTFHGWSEFSRSSHIGAKFFWIATVILILGSFSVNMAIMFVSLYKSEKWSTTVTEVQHDSLPLPQIIICNFNRVNATRAKHYWRLDDDLITYIGSKLTKQSIIKSENSEILKLGERYKKWRAEQGGNVTFVELIKDLGHSCERTILHATFNEVVIPNPCDGVQPMLIHGFGKCLKADPPNASVLVPGVQSGVTVVLDIGLKDHHQGVKDTYLDDGFALFISYGSYADQWTSVPPGFRTWISLKATQTKGPQMQSFAISQAPCARNGRLSIAKAQNYTRSLCGVDCELQAILQECGCIPGLEIENLTTCEPTDMDECLLPPQKLMRIRKESMKCEGKCIDACEEITAETKVSFSKFPSTAKLEQLATLIRGDLEKQGFNISITKEDLRNTLVALNIFFSTLSVKVVQWYERMPLDQIISNIGGQLGLTAGISLITVVHMIFFMCLGLCGAALNKDGKKQSEQCDM